MKRDRIWDPWPIGFVIIAGLCLRAIVVGAAKAWRHDKEMRGGVGVERVERVEGKR